MEEKTHRMGKVVIGFNMFKKWRNLKPIFAKFVPTHIESNYAVSDVTYVGYSDMFDEIDVGDEPPMYDFRTYDEDGKRENVTAKQMAQWASTFAQLGSLVEDFWRRLS